MWHNLTSDAAIQTSVVRSGTYAAICPDNANLNRFVRNLPSAVTSGTYYFRAYIRWSGSPSVELFGLMQATNNTNNANWRLKLSTGGQLILRNSETGTDLATTSGLTANTWYRVEIKWVIHDSTGELHLYVDGVEVGSGQTGVDTLDTNFNDFRLATEGDNGGVNIYFDDVAINVDDASGFQDGLPGAGKIDIVTVGSNVTNDWEDETAGASTFNNVDDIPGAVNDADFNQETAALNSIDRFGLATLPAGIDSGADMVLMDVYARVGGTAASTAPTSGRLKIWDEGSILTNGPTVDFAVNGWRILANNEHQVFNLGTRTKANVQSFNVGYENITDTATKPRRVSALWANVEWIDGSSGAAVFLARRRRV
jgi:hypothetical protein